MTAPNHSVYVISHGSGGVPLDYVTEGRFPLMLGVLQ